MAEVRPLRGLRYDPARVDLGRVLAPPYDVIGREALRELRERDPHNIVRVDIAADEAGGTDGYSIAADNLRRWQQEGVLRRDDAPALYVLEHDFPAGDGALRTRRGIFGRILARSWPEAPIRPHERTLPGPKQDRLCLMRASEAQTSPVFGLWEGAPGMPALLDEITVAEPATSCSFEGEMGCEWLRLWVVAAAGPAGAIADELRDARLYVADGHHRYETAAFHAGERRRAEPGTPADAGFEHCLVHLCAADDAALVVLPTHRLIPAAPSVPSTVSEVMESVRGRFATAEMASLERGAAAAAARRGSDHAFAVTVADGTLLLSRPRRTAGDARAQLDVSVLEEELLAPWGIGPDAIAAGALGYERDAEAVAAAVRTGRFALGAVLNGCTARELIAVADSGGTMPQKATYFYPKVPTGLVIATL